MMRELEKVVKETIETCETNGYKWELIGDILKWSYCDVEFLIEIGTDDDDDDYIKVSYDGIRFVEVWICNHCYADAATLADGMKIAITRTIGKANKRF